MASASFLTMERPRPVEDSPPVGRAVSRVYCRNIFLAIFLTDARTFVADRDENVSFFRHGMNVEGGVGRGVFDGVGDEIIENLHGGGVIGFGPQAVAKTDPNADLFAGGGIEIVVHAFLDHGAQIALDELGHEFALFDGIGIQKIGDQIAHPLGGLDDIMAEFGGLGGVLDEAQQFGAADDHGEGIFQIMRGHAEELVLFLVQVFELGVGDGEFLERILHFGGGPGAAAFKNDAENEHEKDQAEIAGGGDEGIPFGIIGAWAT